MAEITKDSPDWFDSQDAMVWAEKFVEIHRDVVIGSDQADEGTMVCWFANAMAAATRQPLQAPEETDEQAW